MSATFGARVIVTPASLRTRYVLLDLWNDVDWPKSRIHAHALTLAPEAVGLTLRLDTVSPAGFVTAALPGTFETRPNDPDLPQAMDLDLRLWVHLPFQLFEYVIPWAQRHTYTVMNGYLTLETL